MKEGNKQYDIKRMKKGKQENIDTYINYSMDATQDTVQT